MTSGSGANGRTRLCRAADRSEEKHEGGGSKGRQLTAAVCERPEAHVTSGSGANGRTRLGRVAALAISPWLLLILLIGLIVSFCRQARKPRSNEVQPTKGMELQEEDGRGHCTYEAAARAVQAATGLPIAVPALRKIVATDAQRNPAKWKPLHDGTSHDGKEVAFEDYIELIAAEGHGGMLELSIIAERYAIQFLILSDEELSLIHI